MNLFVRKLRVQKIKFLVGSLAIALLVGCEQVSEDAKAYLINTGWLKLDGVNKSSLNADTNKSGISPQLVAVGTKLYAIYTEYSGSVQYNTGNGFISYSVEPPRVAVFNNNELTPVWTYVDNGVGIYRDLTKGTGRSDRVDAQGVAFNSKLYVLIAEQNLGPTNATNLRVAVYNGNDSAPSWNFVDGNGAAGLNRDTTKEATHPKFHVFNNKLYLIWQEDNASHIDQARVAVYNGNDSAPSWNFVDGNSATVGLNKNPALRVSNPTLITLNSKLYAYWSEADNNTTSQARMAVYNGNDSAPSWSFVDGNSSTIGFNADPTKSTGIRSAVVLNGKLYLATNQNNNGISELRFLRYNGDDNAPSFTLIGNGPNNPLNSVPLLIVHDSKIYASYAKDERMHVAVYNGNDNSPKWTAADGVGLSMESGSSSGVMSLEVFDNKLFAIWFEQGGFIATRVHVAVKIK